ncbi:hypothetical protein [Enemella sp. A6]|uniref:hypothetical protein n=1 Tax=Enemella sp. A6 TaxID=3440152 RepID=UPI003EBEDA59
MLTAVAVTVAVIAAVCFAWAATLQHRAIGQSLDRAQPDEGRLLNPRRLWLLINSRGWLVGTALVGAGAALHIVGLTLAPVSIIQPVGVLAVPLAVLFAARLNRRRPSRRLLGFALITVAGITTFVFLSVTHDSAKHAVNSARAPWGLGVLSVLMIGCVVIALVRPARDQCLAWAAAAAAGFGLGSALLRMLTLLWHREAGWGPLVLYAVLMLLSWTAGAWFHQQAYAAGPAEVVLGVLNVIDPLVAVVFGVLILGEGGLLTVPVTITMAVVGLVAAAGVVLLSRHHPEARRMRSARPGTVPVV